MTCDYFSTPLIIGNIINAAIFHSLIIYFFYGKKKILGNKFLYSLLFFLPLTVAKKKMRNVEVLIFHTIITNV